MRVDFFIVGAPKAGTTSLFYYLKNHPDIIMSSVKEPNYFTHQEISNQNLYYKKENFGISTLERYHALFPPQVDSKKFGEGSVSYLFYPETAKKIYDYNYEATKESIANAMAGEPSADAMLAGKDAAEHPFRGF